MQNQPSSSNTKTLLLLALLATVSHSFINHPQSRNPNIRKELSIFKSLAGVSSSLSGFVSELKGDKLLQLIEKTKSVPEIKLIVDFYNPSCPHCQNFAPVFESAAREAKKANPYHMFAKVDVTKYSSLVGKLGINFIPDVRVSILPL